METERRVSPRVELAVCAVATIREAGSRRLVQGTAVNLSGSGAAIRFPDASVLPEAFTLLVRLPTPSSPMRVAARVRVCHAYAALGKLIVGVEFERRHVLLG